MEEIEKGLEEKRLQLKQSLENLRKKQHEFGVNELKVNLKKQNRCLICTLKLPCRHYPSADRMPTPPPPEQFQFSIDKYTVGIDIDSLNLTYVPQARQTNTNFCRRYRDKPTRYTHSTLSPRFSALPNTKRLILMEQIQAYKLKKLQNQLEKIQKGKFEKQQKKVQEKEAEIKRRKRGEVQKKKVTQYYEELERRRKEYKMEQKRRKRDSLNQRGVDFFKETE